MLIQPGRHLIHAGVLRSQPILHVKPVGWPHLRSQAGADVFHNDFPFLTRKCDRQLRRMLTSQELFGCGTGSQCDGAGLPINHQPVCGVTFTRAQIVALTG